MYSIIQKHKKLAALIIAVASVSFLFWMFTVADIKQMFGKKGCVALVNGECVGVREFRYELLRYLDVMKDPDLERAVKRRVVSDLVVREILFQKASKTGLLASEAQVAEVIKNDRTFWENGSFSLEKYKETLSRLGMTPQEYEGYIRKRLSIERLFRFIASGVYLTEEEREVRRRVGGMRFSGRAYLITEDYVKVEERPSEEELRRFYEENRERFSLPQVMEFRVWETEKKEEAHRLYRALKGGEVREGGRTYRLSENKKPDLPPEVLREMERLKREGSYSITKVGNTYYVIYLQKVHPKSYRPFEEVKGDIEREVLRERKFLKMKELAETLKDKLKRGQKVPVRYLRFEDSEVEEFRKVFGVGEEEILRIVFSKDKVFGPYRLSGGYALLVIESRKMREVKDPGDEEMLKEKVRNITDLFVEKLIRDARIDINEEYIR
jgi:peptidyl-prolyl cis-trans isomerase D